MSYYFVTINRKDTFLVDEADYKSISEQVANERNLHFTAIDPKDMTKFRAEFIRWPSILNVSIRPADINDSPSSKPIQ